MDFFSAPWFILCFVPDCRTEHYNAPSANARSLDRPPFPV